MSGIKNTYLHYAKDKRSTRWYREVANLVCSTGGCVNLLAGKNVKEINEYASGKIDMKPYYKDFKSEQRKVEKAKVASLKAGGQNYEVDYSSPANIFQPLGGLLTVKLNSFVQLIGKTDLQCKVVATDDMASKKIERDIKFLKDRPEIQDIKQDLADQLGQGDVDAGTTTNSLVPMKEAPYGLDLNDPSDVEIYKDIFYKFKPSSAYEYALKKQFEIDRYSEISLLESRDQAYYGVAVNETYFSSITGLGKLRYVYPGDLYTTHSEYADKRDVAYGWARCAMTPTEFFDNFGHEMEGQTLEYILNGTKGNRKGCYAQGNIREGGEFSSIDEGDYNSYKLIVKQVQFKTIDGINIATDEFGNKRFVVEGMQASENDYSIYVQNTDRFYCLNNTDYFFGKEKLGYAYRTQGQEAFTTLSWNIYKSQEKSIVEQCIPLCKAAQIAFIKLLHEVVKSAPSGKYVNMAFVDGFLKNLELGGQSMAEVKKDYMDMIAQENLMFGDTTDFDGATQGNFKPYEPIVGGLRLDSVQGYLQIIRTAQQEISRATGINDEMGGMNNNPDVLNGARTSMITYGMNAINNAYIAKNSNYTPVYNVFAWYIKEAVEKGGKYRDAVEKFIGKDKTCMIDGLDGLKEHTFYLKVTLGMRQEDIQQLNESIARMEQKGLLSRLERLVIDQTENITDAYLILGKFEDKKNKEIAANQQAAYQQAQQLENMRSQTIVGVEQVKTAGKKELASLQGEIDARIFQLRSQLGLPQLQAEGTIKGGLQRERLINSLQRDDKKIQAKKEMQMQDEVKPLF